MPDLQMPDGGTLSDEDVNREFARSMAKPEPDEETAPAPKPRQPKAEGGDESKAHSKPRVESSAAPAKARRSSGGRKAKAAPEKVPDGMFVQPVAEFLQGLTMAASLLPVPHEGIRVRARLQAAAVEAHAGPLAGAVDAMARNNATIRRGVEALTMGSAGWVLPAAMAVVPFALQSAAIWRTPLTPEMVQAADAFEGQAQAAFQEMVSTATAGQDTDARPEN